MSSMSSNHAMLDRQGEQRLASVDAQRNDIPSTQHAPRDTARRFSLRGDLTGRKFSSGSPQIHHFLTSTSPVPEDPPRRSTLAAPRPSLRRWSSADLNHLQPKSHSDLEGSTSGNDDSEQPGSKAAHENRGRTPAQLSPCVRPHQPASSTVEETRPGSSSGSSSTIRVATREHVFLEDQLAAGNFAGGPTYGDPFTRPMRDSSASDDARQNVGVEDAWDAGNIDAGAKLSPLSRSTSSSSSVSSGPQSDASSEQTTDTDVSLHEHEVDGNETPIAPVPVTADKNLRVSITENRRSRGSISDPDRYGTPEMPRGSAKLPHIPASHLTPRMPSQGHAKHLPRAEKLPMSGYELLASSISSTGASSGMRSRMGAYLGMPSASHRAFDSRRNSSASFASAVSGTVDEEVTVKPIYRKFEVLNHRLLLQLQDELSELEEQLHRLDTTDTQTRRLRSSILPASRRAEFLAGGELQWHKTDILGKITFKLGQYNHLLSSFTATRDLPAPSLADVTEYRTYLATRQPISEVETRFLDPIDDLVTLAAPAGDRESSVHSSEGSTGVSPNGIQGEAPEYLQSLRINEEPVVTPIPGTMHGNSWLVRHNRLSRDSRAGSQSSAASSSPRFARHEASSPGPLRSGHQHVPLAPSSAPLRSPGTPLREAHSVADLDEKHGTGPVATNGEGPSARMILHVVAAVAAAVLVPILSFPAISDFSGRMVVVFLVATSVFGCVMQSGSVKLQMDRGGDLAYSAAIYAAVMAVAARVAV